MGDRLKERVAIVTGSGQGIGKAIAIALAMEGAKVLTNNRRPGTSGGDAETTAKEIMDMGGQAVPFFGSVSESDVAQKLIQTAMDSFGRLDILVNNAGVVGTFDPIWDTTEEAWDNVIAVNLKGTFNCIRHACAIMKEQGSGRIINATSGSRLGEVEHCSYSAAKAGVIGLTKSVALEMGSYGVTCNAYAPFAATRLTVLEEPKTHFYREYKSGVITKEIYDRLINPPPPETIPPFLIYLCTDEAADISGQVFSVSGQRILLYTEEAKNRIVKEEGLWTIEELVELVPKVLLKGVERTNRRFG